MLGWGDDLVCVIGTVVSLLGPVMRRALTELVFSPVRVNLVSERLPLPE